MKRGEEDCHGCDGVKTSSKGGANYQNYHIGFNDEKTIYDSVKTWEEGGMDRPIYDGVKTGSEERMSFEYEERECLQGYQNLYNRGAEDPRLCQNL